MPQIEVTFDIDANGIVHVSAKDQATGKEQKIAIQSSGGLSDDDIERMVREAEENAEADKRKREVIETRNGAETQIHMAEKQLKEHEDKIPAELKAEVEAAITEARSAIAGDDLEAMKPVLERFGQKLMKIGEIVYKAQSTPPSPDEPIDVEAKPAE
jgi:molecular chaperone DnaK